MFKVFVPRTLLQGTPHMVRRRNIHCKSNQAMIDLIVGVIALGVIVDVGTTLMKKKWKKHEEPLEVIEPIVMDEEDDGKSEAERVIDVDLE